VNTVAKNNIMTPILISNDGVMVFEIMRCHNLLHYWLTLSILMKLPLSILNLATIRDDICQFGFYPRTMLHLYSLETDVVITLQKGGKVHYFVRTWILQTNVTGEFTVNIPLHCFLIPVNAYTSQFGYAWPTWQNTLTNQFVL